MCLYKKRKEDKRDKSINWFVAEELLLGNRFGRQFILPYRHKKLFLSSSDKEGSKQKQKQNEEKEQT